MTTGQLMFGVGIGLIVLATAISLYSAITSRRKNQQMEERLKERY